MKLEANSGNHLVQAGLSSQLQQIAQGFAQLSFEILQGWRLHSLYGKPMMMS